MIPRIDVRSSIARKTYAGELTFDEEAEAELLDLPFVEFSSPVTYSLRYVIFEDNAVEVKGRVTFSLKGACSRCLSEAEETISAPAEGLFLPGESDGENYGYTNGIVDLNEFVRDAVMFALPPKLLCGACTACEEDQE